MPRLVTPVPPLGIAGQAARHNIHERRRGRTNPEDGLFRTHSFLDGDTILATQFPAVVRDRPVTIAFDVFNPSPGGSLDFTAFRVGDTSPFNQSLSCVHSGNTLSIIIGSVTDSTNSIIFSQVNFFPASADWDPDKSFRIVLSVDPGTGQLRVWRNGDLVARAQTSTKVFTGGVWAGGNDGITLNLQPGVIIPRVDFFVNQRPRQFEV